MPDTQLPQSVLRTTLDGRDIYLVGTAHVSKASVDDVRVTIAAVKPDTVCIELCEGRYRSLTDRDTWKKMDIYKVIRQGKAVFLLAQLLMTSFYRQLGQQLGTKPGAEMLAAADLAKEAGCQLVLADRAIDITLRRVWGSLGFWGRMKLAGQILFGLFGMEKIDAAMIERLRTQDQLETVMQQFAEAFPQIKSRLIDERDVFLAQKIRSAPGKTVVAVVGAGHVQGILANLPQEHALEPLMQLPPKSPVPAIVGWSIPIVFMGLLALGFMKGGAKQSIDSVYIWAIATGTLAALGAVLALAHPLTILTSLLFAPLTPLHFLVRTGWVAGLVEAWVRKPTVADLEDLPDAVSTLRGFWRNAVTKILLVVVLVNLGSTAGMFVAGSWIAAKLF
jgi:pheromone shutdown-related protein TraB